MTIKKYLILIICLFIVLAGVIFTAVIQKKNEIPSERTKVSVIVPVYNGQKYLKRAAKCLLNQTLDDYEIVFVNDGSTDDTAKIMEDLRKKHKKVRVITQENQGAGAARNTGLDNARGDYVVFLDVDDTFEKDMLKEMYNKAVKTNSDIVVCNGDHNVDGVNTKVLAHIDYRRLTGKEVFNYKDIPENIFQFTVCCAWNKMFKKSFLIKNNIRFPKLRIGEDQYFVHVALVNAERISVIVDKLLMTYHTSNKGSQTRSVDKHQDDAVTSLNMFRDYLVSKNLYKTLERSFLINYVATFHWNYFKISDEYKPLFIERHKKDLENLKIFDKDFRYYYNIDQFMDLKKYVNTDNTKKIPY